MDSRVGQTITDVLYAMQTATRVEEQIMKKEKLSGEQGGHCTQKDGTKSEGRRTNGEMKFIKSEPESIETSDRNPRKRPAAHNGLPKGWFSHSA